MKKLLVLGASYTQTPLYELSRKMGIKTVAMSIPGPYPGFQLADETDMHNIADPDAVLRAAEEHHVDGIVTCGLDLGMRAIGAAAEALGLPGPSKEAASKAANKLLMKKALVAAGVQTAPFYCVHSEGELKEAIGRLHFPVIVKAVDLMGGRGIYRSDTPEEARKNYERTMSETHQDYCLVEEFIEGEIFGVESMIQNGKILYMEPNNIVTFRGPTPLPLGHSVPYRYQETLGRQIREQVERAVAALGLDNCPLNCDFIRRGDKVYVIELTGRSGANGLPEMVGASYGINYYEVLLRIALGEDVSHFFAKRREGAVLASTVYSERGGTLREIQDDNLRSGWLRQVMFNVRPGDHVNAYTNGRDRLGQVVITAPTLDEAEKRLGSVRERIHFRLDEDLPITRTPVFRLMPARTGTENPGQKTEDSGAERELSPMTGNGNRIFVKREDALPFSFGGNKVRFAEAYLEDMQAKGCDAMIMYGGYHSNFCRIMADACATRGIPCAMIDNIDDAEPDPSTGNARLVLGAGILEYRCHRGSAIASAVQKAMDDLRSMNYTPYYMHGDITGQGNEHVPMSAYVDVYREIEKQEEERGVHFSKIFLASSTSLTHSGLLAAHLMDGDEREIIGISVTRKLPRAREVILGDLAKYREKKGAEYRLDPEKELHFEDAYLCGGYGQVNEDLLDCIADAYYKEGLCLDPFYSGKAYYGMLRYLDEQHVTGEDVLFLHTGGTPLFYDALPEIMEHGRKSRIVMNADETQALL